MFSKLKRKIFKYIFIPKTLLVGAFIILLLYFAQKTLLPFYKFAKQNSLNYETLSAIIFNNTNPLKKSSDRTNILIMGRGGGNHEGPFLTDSIIFLSLSLKSKDAVLVSIPSDVYSPLLKDRINSAYERGEIKKKGGGLILSKSIIEEIVGLPIHYAWIIDFSGFKKIIDLVGGIDVDIDRSFDDYEYPIEGKENADCGKDDPDFKCRYEHISFKKGMEHMDGERALKFVRSRHAEGQEGTDFARSQRQQKVMLALKEKLLSKDIQKISNLKSLYQGFNEATDTDMKLGDTLVLARFLLDFSTDNIRKPVLDWGDEEQKRKGFFVNPPLQNYDGQWVLIPSEGEGNYSKIHKYIACWIENPKCEMTP